MFVLNTVTVSGGITRDPESFADGKGAKFGLAVSERFKKGDEWTDYSNYFDVVAWGSLGEQIIKQCSKGSQIAIKGRLRQDRWEKDGDKRSKVGIVAEAFFFPKGNGGGSGGSTGGDVPADTSGLGSRPGIDTGPISFDAENDVPFL